MNNYELPNDVSWYCLVRWLSISNVLGSFFELLDPIKQFMEEKGKSFPELNEPQWLLDLAFFKDVVQYLFFSLHFKNIALQCGSPQISFINLRLPKLRLVATPALYYMPAII
ncbi:unnamed protein product [Macrosiphum euphorbiae]|uniref:Uncharacterized protein n=1 Tax=Macrosiphum euphorbiae TaxID=13131 RepID=A0AAV0X9B1_9HEMI|nr:unnamed protein product [Macrosiphum euphorbiae]